MTQKGNLYLKLDAENRVVKISTDVGGTAYVARLAYDGDGRRVKRVDSFGTTHYLGPHYERNVGTGSDTTEVITRFYHAQMGNMRRLVAIRRTVNGSSSLFYVVPDHLGGTLRTVDSSGNLVDDIRYHAFGGTRSGGTNTPTDKRFTGETLDASSGLYCLGARYYDPVLGRFISPDPLIPNFKSPQSLNRYSYALNNPVKYIDPSGYDEEDPDGGGAAPEEPGPSAGDLDCFDLGWAGGAPTANTGGWDDLNSFDQATFGAPPDPSGLPPDGDIPAPDATPSPTPTPEPSGPVMLVPDTDSPKPAPPDMEPPVEQGQPQAGEPAQITPYAPTFNQPDYGKVLAGAALIVLVDAFFGAPLAGVMIVQPELAPVVVILEEAVTLPANALGVYLIVTGLNQQVTGASGW